MTDAILFGYEIKENYTLLANLRSVHMDEKHWGDPKEFRPERFINDRGEYVEDPWLITFGLGKIPIYFKGKYIYIFRNTDYIYVC